MKFSKKQIIAILAVLILCFTLIFTTTYADPISIAIGGLTGISGAGLFGTVSSFMGADVQYSGASTDPYDMMWTASQDDPVTINISDTHKGTGIDGDDYDYITLDSQGYNDIATAVIENWIHDNNITNNSSGNITSAKNFRGLPLSTFLGQTYVDVNSQGTTYRVGASDVYFEIEVIEPTKLKPYLYIGGQQVWTASRKTVSTSGNMSLYIYEGSNTTIQVRYTDSQTFIFSTNVAESWTPATTIPWTSGNIDTTKGTNYTSPTVKIPLSLSTLTTGFTIQEFIQELSRLALQNVINQVIISDASNPPVPPTPLPTTPLGEVPYDEWIDTWGQHVIDNQETGNESLDNIDTNIQVGNDTLESIDTNIQSGNDTLESIDTNIGTTNGILGQIRDWMQSGFNTINSTLNSILSGVQSLVQSIVNATENLIAGILNQIPVAFQTAWNTLKQHVSIWHYVVEWITSITAPLTWIWGIASGTSYYIILPVYASLAGAVVLALYKKFGR